MREGAGRAGLGCQSCLCEFCIDRNRVLHCLVGLVGARKGGGVKDYWKNFGRLVW